MKITEEFLQNRPLSKSSLMEFNKSPKHYIHYLQKKKKDSEAMRTGTLLDIRLLTPDQFDKKIVIVDSIPGERIKGYEGFMAVYKEQKVIPATQSEIDNIDNAIEAAMNTPEVRLYIDGIKKTQIEMRWHNKKNNLPLLGYVDFETMVSDQLFIGDLKKTRSADPDDFTRDIYKYGYHIQAAAYLDAYKYKQFRFPYFINLCIELEEPYGCSIMFYESKTIQEAQDEFYGLLDAFRYCMDNDLFHMGYEFRLMQQSSYFAVRKPGYYRPNFTREIAQK